MFELKKSTAIPKLKCEKCGLESSNYNEVSFYGDSIQKLPIKNIEYYLTEGLDNIKHTLCKECTKKYKE